MPAKYHGRIANTAGDSFLLEFPSAVEAVRFAVAVQEGMSERNRNFPVDRRIEYRIGANVGDVMADGDDLLGDGVNIAARLEGLAEPGGICISRTTRDQVRDRMEIGLRDMGEVEVKNLARPVRAFQVIIGADETDGTMGQIPNLLHKPSMAVMPLENMSRDPEQAFFADGITEDIIAALSRLRWVFVIDRNTSFSYKGQTYDTAQVGLALGIRYVLEGSVRQAGGRIRVTAQIVDAPKAEQIWAERFDRVLDDIFDLQDELTLAIVANIDAELTDSERQLALARPTESLDAWGLYQRGMSFFYRQKNRMSKRHSTCLTGPFRPIQNSRHPVARGRSRWRRCLFKATRTILMPAAPRQWRTRRRP